MHNIFLEDKDKNGCTIAENAGFFKPCLKKISKILVIKRFCAEKWGKGRGQLFHYSLTKKQPQRG